MDGRDDAIKGAHANVGSVNSTSIGVCVHGNYDLRDLTSDQRQSLIHLLTWLCYRYSIDPEQICGHRDLQSTSCPRNDIYAKLPNIRDAVSYHLENGML